MIGICLVTGILASWSAPLPAGSVNRARELREIIQKESTVFAEREQVRRGLLEELDTINSDQNRVRQRISDIQTNHLEMAMARDNLAMELQKQRQTQAFERSRLVALARFVYKVKKDGFLRFVASGENLSQLAGRIRVLYRTFRSHAQLTLKLDERAGRLRRSETQLASIQVELSQLLRDVAEQEQLLGDYLRRKRRMLAQINQKQSHYQKMVQDYRRIASSLSQLFNEFETVRPAAKDDKPRRGTLPFPVPAGRLLKQYGRVTHQQFGTIIFHKGIEIESEHNTPVSAILAGTVEYAGWLKGLGNVLIIRHPGGLYSLSAHLFQLVKEKGARVEQVETVGYVGDTGTDEKASLYFEIRENGKAVNPLAYFSSSSLNKIL